MNEQHLVKLGAEMYEKLELFGEGRRAHELSSIVKQHALVATAAGAIPVPGADLAALAANIWTMYVRINKVVDIPFGEHVVKSIASGVLANLAAVIPGIAVAVAAESVLKFIPGLGTAGGIAVGIAANIAVTYVAGRVYLKALEKLIHSGSPLTEDNIKMAAEEASKDKTFVKSAYAEGKDLAKTREKTH